MYSNNSLELYVFGHHSEVFPVVVYIGKAWTQVLTGY